MRRGLLLGALLLLTGCERGCLSAWLGDRGVGSRGARAEDAGPSRATLEGSDCSDGLARCLAGKIEVSRAAFLPHPCGAPNEPRGAACTCPWQSAGDCERGCVADGLEVSASADVARAQLCKPAGGALVARPPLPSDPPAEICSSEGISCRDSLVSACASSGMPAQRLAVCVHGCEPGLAMVEPLATGATSIMGGAPEILCRRTHAERR